MMIKVLQNLLTLMMILLTVSLISSCGSSSEAQRLRLENDSLRMAKEQLQESVDSYFKTMHEIEEDLARVKQLEEGIMRQSIANGFSKNPTAQIKADVAEIETLLKQNNERIADLQVRLARSNVKLKELDLAVDRLQKSVEEKNSNIEGLYADLNKKAELIAQQELSIRGLRTEKEYSAKQLAAQEEQMNTAWFIFTTGKELKNQGILSSSGIFTPRKIMQGSLNNSLFTQIDVRSTHSFKLSGARARILSSHPESSYTLDKESNNSYVLKISDYKQFWSVTKYLVVQTD